MPFNPDLTVVTVQKYNTTSLTNDNEDKICDILVYDVDSTWNNPMKSEGNLSWYPTQRVLSYNGEGGDCSMKFEPEDPITMNGRQRFTYRGTEGESIDLVFVQPSTSRRDQTEEETALKKGSTALGSASKRSKLTLVPRMSKANSQMDDPGTEKPLTEHEQYWREFRKEPRKQYPLRKAIQGLKK